MEVGPALQENVLAECRRHQHICDAKVRRHLAWHQVYLRGRGEVGWHAETLRCRAKTVYARFAMPAKTMPGIIPRDLKLHPQPSHFKSGATPHHNPTPIVPVSIGVMSRQASALPGSSDRHRGPPRKPPLSCVTAYT